MRALIAAAICLFPLPTLANCVTLWDMTHMPGATFRTQQGSVETARWGTVEHTMREAKAVYQDRNGKTEFWRVYRDGVFETEEYRSDTDPKTGATLLVEITRRFPGRLPPITPGKTWSAKVTDKTKVHNKLTGEDMKSTEKVTISYSFLPSRQVEISGCTYETIPVEATFAGTETRLTRRFIYFPALEAGVMTREQNHLTGTEMMNGITGVASWASLNQ